MQNLRNCTRNTESINNKSINTESTNRVLSEFFLDAFRKRAILNIAGVSVHSGHFIAAGEHITESVTLMCKVHLCRQNHTAPNAPNSNGPHEVKPVKVILVALRRSKKVSG